MIHLVFVLNRFKNVENVANVIEIVVKSFQNQTRSHGIVRGFFSTHNRSKIVMKPL